MICCSTRRDGDKQVDVAVIEEVRIETDPDEAALAVRMDRLRREHLRQHGAVLHHADLGSLLATEAAFANHEEPPASIRREGNPGGESNIRARDVNRFREVDRIDRRRPTRSGSERGGEDRAENLAHILHVPPWWSGGKPHHWNRAGWRKWIARRRGASYPTASPDHAL